MPSSVENYLRHMSAEKDGLSILYYMPTDEEEESGQSTSVATDKVTMSPIRDKPDTVNITIGTKASHATLSMARYCKNEKVLTKQLTNDIFSLCSDAHSRANDITFLMPLLYSNGKLCNIHTSLSSFLGVFPTLPECSKVLFTAIGFRHGQAYDLMRVLSIGVSGSVIAPNDEPSLVMPSFDVSGRLIYSPQLISTPYPISKSERRVPQDYTSRIENLYGLLKEDARYTCVLLSFEYKWAFSSSANSGSITQGTTIPTSFSFILPVYRDTSTLLRKGFGSPFDYENIAEVRDTYDLSNPEVREFVYMAGILQQGGLYFMDDDDSRAKELPPTVPSSARTDSTTPPTTDSIVSPRTLDASAHTISCVQSIKHLIYTAAKLTPDYLKCKNIMEVLALAEEEHTVPPPDASYYCAIAKVLHERLVIRQAMCVSLVALPDEFRCPRSVVYAALSAVRGFSIGSSCMHPRIGQIDILTAYRLKALMGNLGLIDYSSSKLAALGSHQVSAAELENLKKLYDEREADLMLANARLTGQDNAIVELKGTLESRDEEVRSLQRQLEALRSQPVAPAAGSEKAAERAAEPPKAVEENARLRGEVQALQERLEAANSQLAGLEHGDVEAVVQARVAQEVRRLTARMEQEYLTKLMAIKKQIQLCENDD